MPANSADQARDRAPRGTGDHAARPVTAHRWMGLTLRLAAVYNVLWGTFVVIFPEAFFRWAGAEPPRYPELWQCVGMIVAVYGVGYWIAAGDPFRHWPIVLVGLLGKVFGPIGFVDAALIRETFPPQFLWTIVTNDLIWWVPFALILVAVYRKDAHMRQNATDAPPEKFDPAVLENTRTADGRTLASIADESPVLLVFLRHFGCTFCREAMADLAKQRDRLNESGVVPVLVHMLPDTEEGRAEAEANFKRRGLPDVAHIADPDRTLYQAFELERGRLGQLFGWRVWIRGIRAGLINRHGVGRPSGDPLQMPGAFLVHKGRVIRAYRHRDAADRPDYCALAAS